ncbi:MAG: xanthine dehydrogenase accessory protein XdhC [Pararhizobium sp.]
MSSAAARLRRFAAEHAPLVLIEVREAKGSTPREAGAWMLVGREATHETIGGGQLEFMAIDHTRKLLAGGSDAGEMAVPLGPQIGQCCGGHVGLGFKAVDEAALDALAKRLAAEDSAHPHVYLFGAGHVGHALAQAFAPLPVHLVVVETRAEALADFGPETETRLTAVPEALIEEAPAGSAFVVLTHDHALDFLLVAAALNRTDAAYVGMIGSKTKRATFESWYQREAGGTREGAKRLVSPIGGADVRDKRPAVVAAFVAAEVMRAVL